MPKVAAMAVLTVTLGKVTAISVDKTGVAAAHLVETFVHGVLAERRE